MDKEKGRTIYGPWGLPIWVSGIKVGTIPIEFTKAFYEEYPSDPELNLRDPQGYIVFAQVWYNCVGDPTPIGPDGAGASSLPLKCPGAEWAYQKYQVTQGTGKTKGKGQFVDARDLDMLKDGCCPLSITSEQLGGEDSQD